MHKIHLLLFILFLLPFTVLAEKWTPETLPMVHLKDSTRYVCNPDNVLSPQAVSEADYMLRALERDKGVETVVVVVKQLEGDDPYNFGMELARKYGIGSKQQNSGLILILATEDRSYQILTGTGLEGVLPDAICRRVQNRVMVPELKRRNWDAAIVKTLHSLDTYVRSDASLKKGGRYDDNETAPVLLFFALFAFLSIIFYIFHYTSTHRKCPNCKQAQMRLVKKQRTRMKGSSQWYIIHTFRCPRCGFEKTEVKDEENENDIGTGGVVPPLFFPGGGNRDGGFGGGFGGGSFGGGIFGGGGSGGRF